MGSRQWQSSSTMDARTGTHSRISRRDILNIGMVAFCLIEKLKVYLKEYLGKDFLKELDMAFVSIGQKYGFVSIGDATRKKIADARTNERQKAEAKVEAFRKKNRRRKAEYGQENGQQWNHFC